MTNDRYLFRGFHKEENGKETIYIDGQAYRGKWVEGYYHKEVSTSITLQEYGIDEMENHYIHTVIDHLPYKLKVIPETIGQCVGLSDKNEKLIFENDVVKVKNYHYYKEKEYLIGKIIFKNGMFEIECEDGVTASIFMFQVWSESIEVLRTIFDKEVK